MVPTQHDKAVQFRALHTGAAPFVVANPWDAGSAKALEKLGFVALATSSGGSAAALGKRDGELTRDEALAHARAVVHAVSVPVSADLENGFGDAPEDCAATVRLAASAGLVGCSIEDASGGAHEIYDIELSVRRIAAAAEAARGLPFPFTLTARAENLLRGRNDLADTIARLQAYERAGADVLFAPALPSLDAVREVCSALTRPVNFMVGIKDKSWSVAELAAAGVRRISLATSLYRAAMAGLRDAATEVREHGTFGYLQRL
jgi:2-methylisocitrate lyase-like PEP mutase family enzyme